MGITSFEYLFWLGVGVFSLYVLMFPLKRFIRYICVPGLPFKKFCGKYDNRTLNTECVKQFFNLMNLYLIMGLATGLAFCTVAHLIVVWAPAVDLQVSFQSLMIYGALLGIFWTAVSRISAITSTLLPGRAIFVYLIAMISAWMLYTLVNVPGVTDITRMPFKDSFYHYPLFVLINGLWIGITTEIMLSVVRRRWRVAQFVPFQVVNELRESFEEYECTLGEQHISDLLIGHIDQEILCGDGLRELLWVTLDGPMELAEKISDEMKGKDGQHSPIRRMDADIRIIAPERTGMEIEKRLRGTAKISKVQNEIFLGNYRFLVINGKRAIIYFRIPVDVQKAANIAQIIDNPYRVQAIRSHFLDWWNTLESDPSSNSSSGE